MDIKNSVRQLKISITIRYAVALSLIAILSTFAFFFLHSALKDSNSTAYIVNISGKQRMLSQHIALDVHRIHESLLHHEGHSHIHSNLSRQLLIQNTEEMLIANKMLSTGKLLNKQSVELSPAIDEMYFDQMNLDERVKQYTSTAKQILEISNYQQAHGIVEIINLQSEQLLVDLNKVVHQYEIEGEKKLSDISQLEIIVWISTLFMLFFVALFIFQPMVQHIIKLSEAEERSIENLQQQVEIRTLYLQQANQKLEDLASHDPLTRLRNRLNFEQDLEEIVKQHIKHHSPYAVLMLDIDWFKKINDDYGHDVGDLVLVEIAGILKHTVRQEDKVYRIGGEEFVILLNRVSFEDATKKAEKIRIAIENYDFKTKESILKKTVSGGLYHSSLKEIKDLKTILKFVDEALYESKSKGRNRVSHVQSD